MAQSPWSPIDEHPESCFPAWQLPSGGMGLVFGFTDPLKACSDSWEAGSSWGGWGGIRSTFVCCCQRGREGCRGGSAVGRAGSSPTLIVSNHTFAKPLLCVNYIQTAVGPCLEPVDQISSHQEGQTLKAKAALNNALQNMSPSR